MKPLQISLALSAVLGGLIAALPAQADITKGVWSRGDGQARVRIAKCGAALCVTNVWIKSPGNEKVGDRLVMNVEPTQAGVMSGTAYDPQRKLNYKITVKESGDRMTSSGCVLGGLLCKTESWSR